MPSVPALSERSEHSKGASGASQRKGRAQENRLFARIALSK